ncbi:MAG: hypothetical protein Q8K93_29060 [Reyranella sp.]|uniref:hypothetical protein n=1 Tax=Reyranella sp. TaxID=1929291 RepID=UPI002730F6E8|nr:hypothetical protein [Reyranella sp.]MDP1966240.1 hypothetical protein [Reyranella sp.]MDP2378472.1 hypothetical protein [Reyranella sp.]
MSSAELRYPRQTLWADYMRASAGVLLCGAPLLLLDVNRWLAYVLIAGFLLFALFLVRTALRHQTRYVLGPDTLCADGPAGTMVEWARLDRLKLSYFSTKRDRSDGWMQLSIGSTGGRAVKVDSSLDGFHDIVERAARAAEAGDVALSEATRTNLRSMGISVAGQEELA